MKEPVKFVFEFIALLQIKIAQTVDIHQLQSKIGVGFTHQWLSARLQYLQSICNGNTSILHLAFIFEFQNLTWHISERLTDEFSSFKILMNALWL